MRHMRFVMIALAALALVIAGCDREITGDVELADQSASNCFDCHSDQDWDILHAQTQHAVSVHGTGHTFAENEINDAASCQRCHTHEGFVANLNPEIETGSDFTRIDCFTCHAPHSSGNLSLRVENAVTLMNGVTFDRQDANLCASCHMSRRNVDTYVIEGATMGSRFGPHHSNHADMLIGTNAYEYEGYSYTTSWHGQNIEDGCISCHMADKSVWANVGGHTWNMAAESEEEEEELENIGACTQCHESFESFNADFPTGADYDGDGEAEGVQAEVASLLDSLHTVLFTAGLVDEEGTPRSGTAGVDSLGAVFNFKFVEEERSLGIHNTNYAVGLLLSSINYIVYGDPNGSEPTVAGRPATFSAH